MNRKQFFITVGIGGIFAALSSTACKKSQPTNPQSKKNTDPCADLSGLTETDLQLRKSLSYVAESPYSDQLCDNCQYWIAAKEGQACGGCVSIRGPIHPKGYCSYWAAVV